ncbi:uncharacterized protein LOC117290384 [Asterias rubens]|uniref:uncharacterized protein LOC117290384 n=1 Tax=Asterias rubens TaxID=7604 RepID=UPI0014554D43|nr:uncharacterized protein LOC117290384 [Asterias rubens]XP_033627644.1 uncharacterized protein LOC117290384 [Asterias rubens]XP_033627645.1 uncharacterized protein LOC117290384 [Asterias rubens]
MEDLPIQPGICATRIRSYTEGTIQRPKKLRSGCPSGSGNLFKSVSSVQLAHNVTREPRSSSSQHELNKSCDYLQGRVKRLSRRTFVSSVNIALVKSQPQRKMSLPCGPASQQHGDKIKSVELSESCKSVIGSSSSTRDQQMNGNAEDTPLKSVDEKNLLDIFPDKENLPWEINDEFPHIPVLRRIQQFETQTTPNSRSSSPGRWKLKGKTNYKKGSVHSSPALSRKNSLEGKVIIRNSRNSSPAILHSEILRFQQESNYRTRCEVGNSSSKTDTIGSELKNSEVQVDSSTTELMCRSEIIQAHQECGIPEQDHIKSRVLTKSNDGRSTADKVSNSQTQREDRDSSMDVDSESIEILQESVNQDFSTEKGSDPHVIECSSMELSREVIVNCERASTQDEPTNGIPQEDTSDCSLSKDEVTESYKSGLRTADSFCLNENRSPHLRDQGRSVCVDTFVLEPLHDNSSESDAEQQTDDGNASLTGKDTLNLSGNTVVDASVDASLSPSSDCQPAGQSLTLSPGNKSMITDNVSTIQGMSSDEEVLDVQCNRPDLPPVCVITQTAEHCQSVSQLENPDPIQPLIGEILQASHSIDTDIYSQRCSQQLGEFRTDSAERNASTATGRPMEELLVGGQSPCLSDCYSSSSDEESQLASGTTLDFVRAFNSRSNCVRNEPLSTCSSSSEKDLPKEDEMHETNFHKTELPSFFSGAQTSNGLSIDEDPKEDPKESADCHSNPDTDDSSSSSSSSGLSDSFDCIQAVLKSNDLLHLPSALGACGGLPSSEVVAINSSHIGHSDDKVAFSRHLSALLKRRENNADQALFLSQMSLLLDWIRRQPSPASEVRSSVPMPPATQSSDSRVQEVQGDIQSSSNLDTKTSQVTVSPTPPVDGTTCRDLPQHAVKRKETEVVNTKPIKRFRQKRYVDPDKYSHLRYLILQSPLVLSDEDDSDSDDSDVELNEFGEVKQDYPLGRVPDYIVAQIFCNLITKDLASLKCACKDFKWLIEKFDIKGTDSKWSEESPYREDPCMQCGKIRDPRGDVSLCRWHPKIYYKNGEIGRHYWTCCFANEEDAPGCTTSLHNNKWSGPHLKLCKVPRSWRQYWRSYPMDS